MIKNFLDSDEEPRADETPSPDKPSGRFSSILSITDDIPSIGAQRPEALPNDEPLPSPPDFLPSTESVIEPPPEKPTIRRAAYTPPTADESVRMSGLAWSAGIMLFGSIVFMLILGWFADLLFGSSPWGIVIGMVIGAIIGFVQIFRINAEILRTPKTQPSMNILSQATEIAEPPKPSNDGPSPLENNETETRQD